MTRLIPDFNNVQTFFTLGTRFTRVWAWEGGTTSATSNDEATRALFDLAVAYIFDNSGIPADDAEIKAEEIAPSIHAAIQRRRFAAESAWKSVFTPRDAEEAGFSQAELDASWEDQIYRVHEALSALDDAEVMARWIRTQDRDTLTSGAIEEDPGFDKILKRTDDCTALNLLFRYMDSLVDYDLIVNVDDVDKTVLRPNA